MFTFQIIFHDRKISKEARVLPKRKVDDKASSKTHLVRLMHNVITSKFKIFSVAKARCWNTRLSPKTPKVFPVPSSSSKNPVPRINHGVDNDISTVLLSSYKNKTTTTEQNKTNAHTHTHTQRPKTKPNVARSESTRKQRPTVSANPHLRKEGRRIKRKRKWNNITHATHLKFRASEVQFAVTAQQIQNVLNENLSPSRSRLAKIGTEWRRCGSYSVHRFKQDISHLRDL